MAVAVSNYKKMATIGDVDPDELLTCPYDPVHRVASKRFPYHLMKCKKNYPTVNLEACPFNARHLVPKHEYRHHLCTCPDKVVLEQDVLHHQAKEIGDDGAFFKGNTDVPPYHNPNFKMPSPTENWDIDSDESPHDTENRQPNFVKSDLMTPSERRREHERLKREAVRRAKGKPAVPRVGDPDYEEYMNELRAERQREKEQQEKPVRRPRHPPAVLQRSLTQPEYGTPKIAANIYGAGSGQLASTTNSTALVPTDHMFKQAALNIANIYSQTGSPTTNSVLGHVAKATATNAYLEEIGHRGATPLSVSVPTARSANSLLAIAQTVNSSSCAPVMKGVTSTLDTTDGARVASWVMAGTSSFQNAPPGHGRGRGRGIMDLLTLKKPGGSVNGQAPRAKIPAVNGEDQPEWPTLTDANGGKPQSGVSNVQGAAVSVQSQEAAEHKKKKRIRKLNKKLREIVILEEKKKNGDTLNEEEEKKINKKDRLVDKLAAVTLE